MVDSLFYLCAIGAVLCAVGVIVARSPVVSVISLLGSFACVAVIYLLSGFQLIAALQILVYAGAIMVLFLFVVMLLNLGDLSQAQSFEPLFYPGKRLASAFAIALAMLGALLLAVLRTDLPELDTAAAEAGIDGAVDIAAQMFTRYSLPFEAASVLLLATAVGVMVLAKRNRPGLEGPGTTTQQGGEA